MAGNTLDVVPLPQGDPRLASLLDTFQAQYGCRGEVVVRVPGRYTATALYHPS